MPYNTRRKSLSLPSLGIHVPVTHAHRAAASRASPNHHGASSSSSSSTATPSSTTSSSPAADMDAQQHPNKKIKRSHGDEAQSPVSTPAPQKKFNHTPPPSPHDERSASASDESSDAAVPVVKKVDLEGINDEIVEAVIVQLQDTGNRPHLVKELATILMQQLKIVQQ